MPRKCALSKVSHNICVIRLLPQSGHSFGCICSICMGAPGLLVSPLGRVHLGLFRMEGDAALLVRHPERHDQIFMQKQVAANCFTHHEYGVHNRRPGKREVPDLAISSIDFIHHDGIQEIGLKAVRGCTPED